MLISALQRFNDYLMERADPRVREWTFMGSPVPTMVVVAIYLSLVYFILPAYMKNRKPFKLKKIIRVYNIFQVLSCTCIVYRILTSGYIQGELNWICQPVDYSQNPLAMRMLDTFHWTYWLKMVEMVETIFFVLRKKFNQVSPLHVYHHSVTICMVWVGCKFVGGGMISVPITLNSIIHILMYTYYYITSLGPKWQKKMAPWKPKLTILQMVQFTILIFHSIIGLLPFCPIPYGVIIIYVPNVIMIYKMFYDFYNNNYSRKTVETNVPNRHTNKSN